MNQKLTLEQKIQFFIEHEFVINLYGCYVIIKKQDYTDLRDPKIIVYDKETYGGMTLYLTDVVENVINKEFQKLWRHIILKNI